jgi:hypothetical protein
MPESVLAERGQLSLPFDGPALSPDERRVYALIRKGRENARSVSELCRLTGLSSKDVRQTVKDLCEEKAVVIVSSTGSPPGFFFPASPEEYGKGVAQLIHRITSLARRVRALDRQAYEKVFGGARLALDPSDSSDKSDPTDRKQTFPEASRAR